MQMNDKSLKKLASLVADCVIDALEKKGALGGNAAKRRNDMTAYQKTEKLLYNYVGFKRIVDEKLVQIEELKKYGVPEKDGSIVAYSPHCGTVQGTVLPEESVEQAIEQINKSITSTREAISMIEDGLSKLESDPYYSILKKIYFEGRTQEDIAIDLSCSQVTISINKKRLVKELAMLLFPEQVVEEIIH